MTSATDRTIDIKLTHSLPAAVSRKGTDKIIIKFDKTIWNDPLSELEVNEGSPLIIKLPRQMDPGTAEAMA